MIRADGGGVIGRLNASVEFSSSTLTGRVGIRFAPATGGTGLTARAQVSADSPQEGFRCRAHWSQLSRGDRPVVRRACASSNMRVQGDVSALRTHADGIATWWDAQGDIAVAGYLSPLPSLGNIARLQLNVWGTERAPHVADVHGYATLMFDPADPPSSSEAVSSAGIKTDPSRFRTCRVLSSARLTPIADMPCPMTFSSASESQTVQPGPSS